MPTSLRNPSTRSRRSPSPAPLRPVYGMPMPRLRRPVRQHTFVDDLDWGTSSPTPQMDDHPLPSPVRPLPSSYSAVLHTFKQQDLVSYTCTFSPRCVISLYFAIALVFIPLGAAVIAGTATIESLGRVVYSDKDTCLPRSNSSLSRTCKIRVHINSTIPAPSYLYYSLTDFYQNARQYAKSRSHAINIGEVPKILDDVSTCKPALYKSDSTRGAKGFNPKEFLYPCGLTAASKFNDTFIICRDEACTQQVPLSKENIAWSTDKQRFRANKNNPLFTEKLPRPFSDVNMSANELYEDEAFLVWMRLSAFRNFDKLYAIINEDLISDSTYFLKIESSFPVSSFNGTKAFRITTTSWFGDRNPFLGTAYLVVGLACLCIASVLLWKHVWSPQPPRVTDPAIWLREHLDKLEMD